MNIRIFFIFALVLSVIGFVSNKADAQDKIIEITRATSTDCSVKDDERRKEIEAFMLKGEYQHDGSIELRCIGTIESVPALLKVLENNPPRIIYLPKDREKAAKGDKKALNDREPRKSYICTYSHAVSALHKITGQNFIDYDDWKKWWEDYQKNQADTK